MREIYLMIDVPKKLGDLHWQKLDRPIQRELCPLLPPRFAFRPIPGARLISRCEEDILQALQHELR